MDPPKAALWACLHHGGKTWPPYGVLLTHSSFRPPHPWSLFKVPCQRQYKFIRARFWVGHSEDTQFAKLGPNPNFARDYPVLDLAETMLHLMLAWVSPALNLG